MNTPVCLLNSSALQNAYLIVDTQLESTHQTIIFSIDKNTGGIYHAGIPNVDIFPSNEKAIQYLTNVYNLKIDSSEKNNSNQAILENLGQNLIGATIHDNKLVILCVYQHEQITTLFEQPIYVIKDVSYTLLDLNPKSIFAPTNKPHIFYNSYVQLEKSQKMMLRNDTFLKFDIRENHFYSPTLDMNSPFPYKQHSITNGSFSWNKRFLIPFEDNNCLKACIIVFQGGVYNFTKENASITYVIKRSSMFPGTRYNTRGLRVTSSKKIEPANECECELIFSDGQYYYSQTWRRGSPPVLWKTDQHFILSSNVLLENASKFTSPYFYQQIIKRFKPSRIQIVSLLSNKEKSKELKFNDAYEEGIKKVEFISNNNKPVHFGFTRFDINNIDEESKRNHSIIAEEMFRMLQNPIELSDFTRVEMSTNEETEFDTITESISNDTESDDHTTKNIAGKKKMKFNLIPIKTPNKQSVVFRFNCADSLDRTNAGTFFYGVLITAKFAFQKNIYCFMNQKAHQIQSKSQKLWKNPFEYLSDDVINFLKSAFIKSGNIISQLYTSTNAIKARIIEGGPIEKKTTNDSMTSIARRFINYFHDPNRQNIIDDWTKTFHIKNPRFIIDQQHVSFCDGNENVNHSIFEMNEKDFVIKSNGTNITAMFPEPLFLYQISLLVFRRNINENITMTLEIGNNKNEKHIFFKDLLIPTINPKISKKQDPNNCYAWVSYNLRKIASYSNLFPIEPESLKPSTFANIQFTCKNSDNFRIGSIKFIVKKPSSTAIEQMRRISCLNPQDASTQLLKISDENKNINNHRYMLTSKSIKVDNLDQKQLVSKIYDKSICQTENKQIDSSLPSLDELMSFLMKSIQYGISNYNNFNVFVDHCTNPWIFDLSSRIHSQKNRNICPICGKKTNSDEIIKLIKEKQKESEHKDSNEFDIIDSENNDRELLRKSTAYMPNPVFPLFYIKTINLKLIQNNESKITFLCNECSKKYDDLLKSNNIKLEKNHDINEIEEEEEVKDSDEEKNHNANEIEEEEEVKDSDEEIKHDINKIEEEEEVKDSDEETNNYLVNTVEKGKNNDINEIEEEVQNSDEDDENDLGANNNELDDLAIQSNIISHYIDNFVKTNEILNIQQSILPISIETNVNDFINNEVVKLNGLARIYDFPQNSSNDDLNLVLHSSFLSNHSNVYASLCGTEIEFSVCFALFVHPTEIEFIFDKKPNDEFDLNVKVPGIQEDISVTRKDAQFIYDIKIPKNEKDELKYIQSITFNIKSKKDQTDLNLRLKEINIKGYIDKEGSNYNNNNYEKSCNYNNEFQLPSFSQTKNEKWDLTLRTQTFTPSKYLPKKVSGFSIFFPSNNYANVPKYFIIAFYNNQKIVHTIPIILPSDVSYAEFLERDGSSKNQGSQQIDKFYFPIFDQEFHVFDFDLVSVFYIEKSSVINQQNFMFF